MGFDIYWVISHSNGITIRSCRFFKTAVHISPFAAHIATVLLHLLLFHQYVVSQYHGNVFSMLLGFCCITVDMTFLATGIIHVYPIVRQFRVCNKLGSIVRNTEPMLTFVYLFLKMPRFLYHKQILNISEEQRCPFFSRYDCVQTSISSRILNGYISLFENVCEQVKHIGMCRRSRTCIQLYARYSTEQLLYFSL